VRCGGAAAGRAPRCGARLRTVEAAPCAAAARAASTRRGAGVGAPEGNRANWRDGFQPGDEGGGEADHGFIGSACKRSGRSVGDERLSTRVHFGGDPSWSVPAHLTGRSPTFTRQIGYATRSLNETGTIPISTGERCD